MSLGITNENESNLGTAIPVLVTDEVKEVKKVRGRKAKVVKPPSRVERIEKLRERLLALTTDLVNDGFGHVLKPPPPVVLTELPADHDPYTRGDIGKVKEPLGIYLQRVSIEGNFSQRPPFDHVTDAIYRRLIRDFIEGAAMPESKIAALTNDSRKAERLDDPTIRFSVIDGLQRLFCFGTAVLLVWKREKLVAEGSVSTEAWSYFAPFVEKTGDIHPATEALLQRMIRYEVFYKIDLEGLLHYMVTFNTGQRRMSLPVQLEIMQQPLIDALKGAGIPVWREMEKTPGMQRPKDKFSASELMLATQAFITNNAHVRAGDEAEKLLEEERYLGNVGDINDVVGVLKHLALNLHPRIMEVYANDPNKRYVLSAGGTFLFGLAAACGFIRTRKNMKVLEGELERLMGVLDSGAEDPLKLDEYAKSLQLITTSRGKATRRLVYDTFLRFFSGATPELEWADTTRQIVA